MAEQNDRVAAAIYCRVSTEEQAREDKVSLPTQKARAKSYCEAQGGGRGGLRGCWGLGDEGSSRPAGTE